jgi:predicted nuclease of predicted toxin-antitoxin system
MLKLLANENIPRLLVASLRQRGHDVVWIYEGERGMGDPRVLADALQQRRVLLTCDKDFGELIFRLGNDASCGVVLVRLMSKSQSQFTDRVLPVLEANESRWLGHFSVISSRRVRIVELPAVGKGP